MRNIPEHYTENAAATGVVVPMCLTGSQAALEATARALAQCPWAVVVIDYSYQGRFANAWVAYGTAAVVNSATGSDAAA